MKTRLLWLIIVVLLLGIAVWEGLPARALDWVRSSPWQGLLSKVADNESLPGPLFGPLESASTNLTLKGVVAETNKQREVNGAVPLHENSKLNLAAQAKLDDMFRQQYFEHESPDGKSPADVISAAGYNYLVVGENLALGNYKTDQLLVEAWMNSPGHRANIVDQKFDEIGVAVGKGMYEGREVWMAVQEFGTPLAKCPGPSLALKSSVDSNRIQIEQKQSELATVKAKYEQAQRNNSPNTNNLIDLYNRLASDLNRLIDESKELVNRYNSQVNEFNACLEKNG